MHIYNGNPVDLAGRITAADNQYPAGWFLDPAHPPEAVGIIEVGDPVAPIVPPDKRVELTCFEVVDGEWRPKWAVHDLAPEEQDAIAAELQEKIRSAIAQTYIDVDDVYAAAIGKRGPEYYDAEQAARAYVASGYTGEVDTDVSDFAEHNPTGQLQSNQWAADQIIARADAFRAAQKAMRSTRFARQSDMRAAATNNALASAVGAWADFIAATRSQLGLL